MSKLKNFKADEISQNSKNHRDDTKKSTSGRRDPELFLSSNVRSCSMEDERSLSMSVSALEY